MDLNIILILLVIILFFLAFLLFRTLTFARHDDVVEKAELAEVDAGMISAHLAELIRCETISMTSDDPERARAFLEVRRILQRTYPLVHSRLELQIFNEHTLLYTWQGSNPDLAPVVLMAHYDVVPVSPDTLPQWEHAPFSGDIADGFVWGRGTLDIKSQITGHMEAIEALLAKGYRPARTICLAYGHDEEIGGRGQQALVEHFRQSGQQPWAVLDEGGSIYEGVIPGISTPVAMIGTGEKGILILELRVEGAAGHSAFPPKQTSIGILARALAFLEHDQMPARLDHVKPLFKGVGAYLPFSLQLAFANLWLFGGVVRRRLEAKPTTNATIRTTTAPTIFQAGIRENVLPDTAVARVNFRLLPGDNAEKVIAHVKKVIADDRIKVDVYGGLKSEASPLSPTDVPSYQILARSIRQVFPGMPVTSMLVLGATDARHYYAICDQVYRFTPLLAKESDVRRVHGLNERVSVEAMGQMVQFYSQIIQGWGEDFGKSKDI